ncbi:hypothetical protein KA005_65195, partial [bacterium]|nr:hypothetical protein [bacterium]
NAIQSLCTRGILLNAGQIEYEGIIGETIYHYHDLATQADLSSIEELEGIKMLSVRFSAEPNRTELTAESSLRAEVDFFTQHYLPKCYWNFVIENSEGNFVFHSRTDLYYENIAFDPGMHRVIIKIPRVSMRAGVYTLWFRLYVSAKDAVEVADSEKIMLEIKGPQIGGYLDVPCEWAWESLHPPG